MKKSILIISLSLICVTTNAQLKVDSLGRIGIGVTTPMSLLSVGGGNPNYLSYFNANDKNAMFINNNAHTGLSISNKYSYQFQTVGLDINPGGGYSQATTYGIRSITGTSNTKNISIWGGIAPSPNSPTVNIGIYGSSVPSDYIAYTGTYAGYFNGDARVTGTLYTDVLMANSYLEDGVIEEPIGDEPVLMRLSQIDALRLINYNDVEMQPVNEQCLETLTEAGYDVPNEMAPVQTEKSQIHYGLDVEMLKKNFPELVSEDANGNVGINYMEIIPLLVQSIKELTAKVEELGDGGHAAKSANHATDINNAETTDVLSLAQNVPNPFSTTTSIAINVPEATRSAALFIYDMTGKQIKQIEISERGNVTISVTSEGLPAGMYLYSLIADGKVASTKRMILTK